MPNNTLYYGQVACFQRVLAVNPRALMLLRVELTDGRLRRGPFVIMLPHSLLYMESL